MSGKAAVSRKNSSEKSDPFQIYDSLSDQVIFAYHITRRHERYHADKSKKIFHHITSFGHIITPNIALFMLLYEQKQILDLPYLCMKTETVCTKNAFPQKERHLSGMFPTAPMRDVRSMRWQWSMRYPQSTRIFVFRRSRKHSPRKSICFPAQNKTRLSHYRLYLFFRIATKPP